MSVHVSGAAIIVPAVIRKNYRILLDSFKDPFESLRDRAPAAPPVAFEKS